MHFSEGGYEHISKKLFKELNADTYYLEYDTERAGGFEVCGLLTLIVLAADKTFSLWLISPVPNPSF
jgi:hypothetical protein